MWLIDSICIFLAKLMDDLLDPVEIFGCSEFSDYALKTVNMSS